MTYDEIIIKIDDILKNIDSRILTIDGKKKEYSDKIHVECDDPIQKTYEIEKNTYYINKYDSEIKRCVLFKNRCKYYKNYLFCLQEKDIIKIKESEYSFIKNLQDELEYYYDSKIKQIRQKNYINKLCGQEEDTAEIKELEKNRDKRYNTLLKKDFNFSNKKIYTLEYLNFDVEKVVDLLFKKK